MKRTSLMKEESNNQHQLFTTQVYLKVYKIKYHQDHYLWLKLMFAVTAARCLNKTF